MLNYVHWWLLFVDVVNNPGSPLIQLIARWLVNHWFSY